METYTQGPLKLDLGAIVMSGQIVITAPGPDGASHEERKANAARIVACWNACEGISTEDLQIIADAGETLKYCFDRVKDQSDDLLRALERLSAAAFSRDVTMGDPCALLAAKAELSDANKQACAEIDKARGTPNADHPA